MAPGSVNLIRGGALLKRVAILGAGLVSKPLADYLMDRAGYRVLMA